MAEDQNKSGFNLPWANIVALLVAGGGLLTLIPSLRTSRPPDPGGASMPVFGDQTVDSRLWQDPFEEVMKDKEGKQGRVHTTEEFVTAMAREKEKEIRVLIVMMMSGPNAEPRERRLRTRTAVVEGLSRSGFTPRDSEHLGYLHMSWPRQSSNLLLKWISGLPLPEAPDENNEDIPFERFDRHVDPPREYCGSLPSGKRLR